MDSDEDGDPIPRSREYFSQPLGRDAAILSSPAKPSPAKNHSLDSSSSSSPVVESSPGSRSLSYPNYNYTNAPPPTYHHHHSSSSEEIRFPHPLPPHHHLVAGAVSRHPSSSSFSSDGGPMTLDRAMSEFGGAPGTLPEFTGTGGGAGIFKVPVRAAMHPGRPPALELRPHPLRETQFGSFLRTIACTSTQIWAGVESGLRFWNLSEVFDSWDGSVGVKRGDEESAPFVESGKTSPTLCLVVDEATGVVWSGHKDGKIRSWKIDKDAVKNGDDGDLVEGGDGESYHFKEGLAWQAHRNPVLCMAISPYGTFSFHIKKNI